MIAISAMGDLLGAAVSREQLAAAVREVGGMVADVAREPFHFWVQ
jgi:hypothetical protein